MLVNCDFVRFTNFTKDFVPQEHDVYKGYYIIPNIDKLLVAKDGSLLYRNRNDAVFKEKKWSKLNNSYYGIYYYGFGKAIVINRMTLLAMMFLPKPDDFLLYSIELKDPNGSDTDLDNIEFRYIKHIPEFNISSNKRHRDINVPDGYKPTEHPNHPGYYIIPGFDRYVYNPTTMDMLSIGRIIPKSMQWNVTNEGYRKIALVSNSGIYTHISRHRLVGILFLRDDKNKTDLFGEYVINHKNGIPGDDRIENLEWVTYQDNTHHAIKNGKLPIMTSLQVKNVDTGDVLYFPSILSCARYFNMTRDSIIRRLDIGPGRIFPERAQYRRCPVGFDKETPWPIIENIEEHINTHTNIRKVLIRNCITNEVTEYESARLACLAMNISESVLSGWLHEPGQFVHVLPDNQTVIQCKFSYEETEWRPIRNIYIEIEESEKLLRQVIVHDTVADTYKLYKTAKDCANDRGMLATTLAWRLKSNGKNIYPDGCTYRYLKDNYKYIEDSNICLVGWLNYNKNDNN